MATIAVSVSKPDLDVEVEYRFGRAPYLLLVDPETMEWETVDNPGSGAGGGAGVQAAHLLSERQVSAVAGGEFGPNADNALRAAGITVYRCDPGMTAREAVERLGKGELPQAPAATGIGHGRGGGRGVGGGGVGGRGGVGRGGGQGHGGGGRGKGRGAGGGGRGRGR